MNKSIVHIVTASALFLSINGLAMADTRYHTQASVNDSFGQAGANVLQIRTSLRQIDREIDFTDANAAAGIDALLNENESALRDWQSRYPDDRRLPQLTYLLLDDYRKLAIVFPNDSLDAGDRAKSVFSWLEDLYPTI